MTDSLDDLSYDREEDGILVREQLDRAVLTTGPWATLMFLYRDRDRASGQFREPRMAIVRFRKAHGGYRKQSAFSVSTAEQAAHLVAVLERWGRRMIETDADLAPQTDDDDS